MLKYLITFKLINTRLNMEEKKVLNEIYDELDWVFQK